MTTTHNPYYFMIFLSILTKKPRYVVRLLSKVNISGSFVKWTPNVRLYSKGLLIEKRVSH